LNFDYMIYVAVIATATLTNVMFMTYWGRRADRAGNIKVLKATSILVPLVPLLWVINHQLYYLIPVQILSGFAWAGFALASTNFVYDASAPENRTRCIALFNAMNGSAICLGALLGGFLAPHLPPVLGYNLLTLFLLSGLLRGLVAATMLRHFSEVRRVPRVSIAEFLFDRLNFAGLRPKTVSQTVFYSAAQFKAEKVPSISHWHSAWGCGIATASRSPPPYSLKE